MTRLLYIDCEAVYKINMKLFRRENGYYYIYLTRTKKISLKTKDRKEAEKKFRKFRRDYFNGNIQVIERKPSIRLSAFAREYMNSRIDKAPSTIRADRLALQKLLSFLGDVNIGTIRSEHIERFRLEMRKTCSEGSIHTHLRHLKAAFNWAKRMGWIETSPFENIRLGKPVSSIPKIIPPHHLALIKEAADPEFWRVLEIYLTTGMRRSELLKLRWRDVQEDRIVIRREYTKTKLERYFPLTERLKELFGKPGNPDELIFPHWKPDSLSRKFNRLMKKIGLNYRLHDLRHTFTSNLIMQGIDPEIVRSLLGHTSMEMTRHYFHLIVDEARRMLETIDFAPKLHPIDGSMSKRKDKSAGYKGRKDHS